MSLDAPFIQLITTNDFHWQYNTKDSSVKLAYEAQPRPRAVASLSGETIVNAACGTNHTGFQTFHIPKSYMLF